MKKLSAVFLSYCIAFFALVQFHSANAEQFTSNGSYSAVFSLAPVNVVGSFPVLVKIGDQTQQGTLLLAFDPASKSPFVGSLTVGFLTSPVSAKLSASAKSFKLTLAGGKESKIKFSGVLSGKSLSGNVSGKGGAIEGKGAMTVDLSSSVPLTARLLLDLTNDGGKITGVGSASLAHAQIPIEAKGKESAGKSGASVKLSAGSKTFKFTGGGVVVIPDEGAPGIAGPYKAKGFGASAGGDNLLIVKTISQPGTSPGTIVLSSVTASRFNAATTVLLFDVVGATLLPDPSTVTVNAGGFDLNSSQIQVSETQIAVSSTLNSSKTDFTVTALDSLGLTLNGTATVWSGSATLTVTVKNEQGTAVQGASVVAMLGDDPKVSTQASTGADGTVQFFNMPDRTILLQATLALGNMFASSAVVGTDGAANLVLLDINPPSLIDNNDISQGTLGWDIGSSSVTVINHVETGGGTAQLGLRAVDQDLQLNTSGEGPRTMSRTFVTKPDTKAVTMRYRFITSEVPGGYFGTKYNDYFSVAIRSASGGGMVSEANTMNALGLAAFDSAGATAWRKVRLPVAAAGDTVQVDLTVANVADGLLDSQLVVDKITEERVELKVTSPARKLLETNTFEVKVSTSGTVSNYVIEIRRASDATWYPLAMTQTLTDYKHRTAGKFKLRGKADIDGVTEMSPEVDLEVRFPTYAEITAAAAVITATDTAWANTRAAANAMTRREEGFYIMLDANAGQEKYTFSATVLGPLIGPTQTGSVNIVKPNDNPQNPTPVQAAVYVVASFHTHTPTAFRPVGRPVAPSSADQNIDTSENVVGVVYDYVGNAAGIAPAGHPVNSPAQLYHSGPNQRSTPP